MSGPRLWVGTSTVTIRKNSENVVNLPDIGLHTDLVSLGFVVTRDSRPNRFYPLTGSLINFSSDFFAQALGSKYSFHAYRFTFNKCGSLSERQVLAHNLFLYGTGGEPPFYGNCIYGTNNELRGYQAGRYLERFMVATQLEYRLTLPKRFGVVGFGGLGGVVPGAEQFRNKHFLPDHRRWTEILVEHQISPQSSSRRSAGERQSHVGHGRRRGILSRTMPFCQK